MKTTIISRLSMFLFFYLALSNAFAQKEFAFASSNDPYLKIDPPGISSLKNIAANDKVTRKIQKYFSKNFINSNDLRWEGVNDNVLGTKVSNEITTKTLFNEKGKFVYTIDYSSEKILPAYIKTMVMKAYKKYEIISVAKILEANRKIWVIKLDSKNDIATVRVEDGEMEEVGFFQKSH
jgi:hypothetical protein